MTSWALPSEKGMDRTVKSLEKAGDYFQEGQIEMLEVKLLSFFIASRMSCAATHL